MTTTKPLSGIRVVDLTNVLAGPFCCHQLAHLGADVTKVEQPGSGDLARQLGADQVLNDALMGVSFLAQNTGKRSITLDLKSDDGKDILRRLIKKSDVLVENFRPGVMDRLDLGYQALKTINPALVYCAISGFGQTGSMKSMPAYDQIVQGFSGIMSITGDDTSAPLRVGYPIADTIGGLTAAFAISAALSSRRENLGSFIDVSMLESVMATMGWAASNFLMTGRPPQAMGNENSTACPSGTFNTADGLINIAANKQEQFEKLCVLLKCPDISSDPLFYNRESRLQNRTQLNVSLQSSLMSNTAEHWERELSTAGIPAGRVLDVPTALEQNQISARGLVGTFEHVGPREQTLRYVRTGFQINNQVPTTESAPAELGEHSTEILEELGYTCASIRQFQKRGII